MPGTKPQHNGNQNLPIHFALRARLKRDCLQTATKGRSQGSYVVNNREREGVGNQAAVAISIFSQIRGAPAQIRGAWDRNSGRRAEYVVGRRDGLAGQVVNSAPSAGGFEHSSLGKVLKRPRQIHR
ncbi:MAG: hypothetical protein ACKN9U_03790, partial [Pirellulaceae bacterium]